MAVPILAVVGLVVLCAVFINAPHDEGIPVARASRRRRRVMRANRPDIRAALRRRS